MELTAALRADLALLTEALHDPLSPPAPHIMESAGHLAASARLAARSYLGLTVIVATAQTWDGTTLLGEQVLLRFTVLDDEAEAADAATSLRLPLPKPPPWDGRTTNTLDVAVILYAATPGAFMDLAADLSFLTGVELVDTVLDADRALATQADATGFMLAESVIHQAIGVPITRGRTPNQATVELDALALAAGTDRTVEASRILDTLAYATSIDARCVRRRIASARCG